MKRERGRPRSEIKVVCQNAKCLYFMREKGKDIIKAGILGTGHQRYVCHHCSTTFVETKGTLLYKKHLSEDQIIGICKHLVERNGIRSIERLTGHHRDTISHTLKELGEHARKVNEILIKNLHWGPVELDEMWTFLKKSRKEWTPTAIKEMKLATRGYLTQ